MLGNLEPEERVMDDSVMYPGGMLGQLAIALEKMGWESGDDVVVEIAGTSVYEIDGAGTKWAPVKELASTIRMLLSSSRIVTVILLSHLNLLLRANSNPLILTRKRNDGLLLCVQSQR